MTKWTEDNTEGFTTEELEAMNAAQAALEAEYPDAEPQTIADRLNNAFIPGASVSDLVAAARPE